eukprot:Skav214031  [mRNA]  locus=scaffold1415:3261:4514:- [translate_table: standard]
MRIQQLRKRRLQDCPRYGSTGVLITGCAPSRLGHRRHHVRVQRVEVRCLLELLSGQDRLSVVLVEAVSWHRAMPRKECGTTRCDWADSGLF